MASSPLFSLIFFLLCSTLTPTIARADLTYRQALDLAIEREERFKAETLDAEAKRAEGWQSIAGLGPMVTAYLQPSYNHDHLERKADQEMDFAGEKRNAHYQNIEAGVTVNQPIFNLERLNTARQGNTTRALAKLMQQKAREDLAIRLAEHYYAVLSADESLKIKEAEKNTLLEQVKATQERRQSGYGTAIDEYNADSRMELATAAAIAGKAQADDARIALLEILHQEELEPLEPAPETQALPKIGQDLAYWLNQAQTNNTDIQMKRAQAEIARLERLSMLSRFTPKLSAVGSYTYNNPDGKNLYDYEEQQSEGFIGLRLEMDLLTGGSDTAATVAAGRKMWAAQHRVEESKRSVDRSVHSLWNSLNSTYELAKAYEKSVFTTKQALDATQAGYTEGVKALLDVLDNQQKYYNALSQAQTTRNDYMVFYYKFIAITGK